jgi:Uma2 family endonuclease
MVARVLDLNLEERLIAERRALGLDKYDEVWDGVYIMAPWPNDEHQEIAAFLTRVLYEMIQENGLGKVRQGINLTDQPEDWTNNFRVPDVVVFLNAGNGVCHDNFWTGAPDFAVEIVSEGEDPEAKFEFYGGLGTRELLLMHRDPWKLELYLPEPNGMRLWKSTGTNEQGIASAVDLTFSLRGNEEYLELVVQHADGRSWAL